MENHMSKQFIGRNTFTNFIEECLYDVDSCKRAISAAMSDINRKPELLRSRLSILTTAEIELRCFESIIQWLESDNLDGFVEWLDGMYNFAIQEVMSTSISEASNYYAAERLKVYSRTFAPRSVYSMTRRSKIERAAAFKLQYLANAKEAAQ